MSPFLILIFALTSQETLFSHAAIFNAREAGISWLVIHFIWTLITVLHLVVPYFLGLTLAKTVKNATFWKFINKLEIYFSVQNKASGLLFFTLGIFNFVYINSFLLAFLKIKPALPMIYIFLGDLVWYGLVAGSTLFDINILSDIQTLFFAFLVCLAFGFFGGEIIKKLKKQG